MKELLKIENLKALYLVREGTIKATENVSFTIQENSVTAIVGESASGKSTVIEAITRTLPPNGRVVSGKVLYKGKDILTMTNEELRKIRWSEIALVPQAAQQSLNPTMKIIDHFRDTIKAHGLKWTNQELYDKAAEKIKLVRLDPQTILNAYPMQLSGGMKQRVLIALSLLLDPKVLILDEPTSALDVLTQAHIIQLLKDLKKQLNITLIFVTHDIAVAAELADNIFVIYGGCMVECSPVMSIFKAPKHPYTNGLVNSIMSITSDVDKIKSIPGDPPSLLNPPSGCRFHPRCQYTNQKCKMEIPSMIDVEGSKVACFYYE
ncbi:ABC transporter ATP-binding protein [Caldicellulosiruptoraceae bacterium PP1]